VTLARGRRRAAEFSTRSGITDDWFRPRVPLLGGYNVQRPRPGGDQLTPHASSMQVRSVASRRRRALPLVSLTAGVAAGIVFVVTIATLGGLGMTSHTVCVEGASIGTSLFWTPWSLTNAPYLGSVNFSAHFWLYELFGPTNVTLNKGHLPNGNVSSSGYFETENWTVFAQGNASQSGSGPDQPCTSPYGAERSPTRQTTSNNQVPLERTGNTSNMQEPTSVSLPGLAQGALFANGFISANQPPISTCGTSGTELSFSSSSFDISLTVSGPTGPLTIMTSLPSYENFTYDFPANGGTWLIDDLQQNAGLRGPGLAFSWQPC
jgi:hypothetical protein